MLAGNLKVVPVVLCGGAGTRLWPLSRDLYPKQFHKLLGGDSLLQATLCRSRTTSDGPRPIVVCNEAHRFVVAEQARAAGIDTATILLEPEPRNTAPAVALAALTAINSDDVVMLVLPSDHLIRDRAAFDRAVRTGAAAAEAGKFVTFGIVPDTPATGYGYIERGAVWTQSTGLPTYEVSRFVEKPDLVTARSYVEGGNHFWNSGIFMFRAARFLEEFERFEPELAQTCRKSLAQAETDVLFTRPNEEIFRRCAAISIDHAVMERCRDVVVVPTEMGWSDVGSWKGYWEAESKDSDGNVLIGDARAYGVRNSLLRADGKLLVALGVDDLVVIDTEDATLVAAKNRSEEIKALVADLKRDARQEAVSHVEVYRPWGSFKRMECTPYFQVKRLTLKPGARISLQLHHQRSEHWVVVKGIAKVVRGDQTFTLHEKESTFIPMETKHQLENPGDELLEVIEVQTGTYFGEDDIVRFEDVYGRV